MVVGLAEYGRRGGTAPKHKWTDEEREFVRLEYTHTHASRRAIAARLGVTEFAVAGQIACMGIAKRSDRRPWKATEEQRLGELIGRYGPRKIAKLMHRSLNSVVVRSKCLGYSRRTRDGWFTKSEVCEILGVDHKWVQRRIDSAEITARYHHGHRPQQHGSGCWEIAAAALRSFIIAHSHELTARNVDLVSIVWLLTGQL